MELDALHALLSLLREHGVLLYRSGDIELQLDPMPRGMPRFDTVSELQQGKDAPAITDVYSHPDLYDGRDVPGFDEPKPMT